jgi:sec-independent protein translocase protein TatB
MGNLTASEILWILIVILVVFGPQRLPEIARRAGQLTRKARDAVGALTEELDREYGDTLQPLRDVADEIHSARRDLRDAAASIVDDVGGMKLPPRTAPESPEDEPPPDEAVDRDPAS